MTSKNAIIFGNSLKQEFIKLSTGVGLYEVPLFQCLQKAILATAPRYRVEEFHGNRAQVVFPACPPWTKPKARCELSDLCIVWFRCKPHPLARITFLQAKRSLRRHSLCHPCSGGMNESFYGNSTQWYLLNKRPTLSGYSSNFNPPNALLKNALLPSVATFGIFYEVASNHYDFFYASADVVDSTTPKHPGCVRLKVSSPVHQTNIHGFDEQKHACCLQIFGAALYDGYIGTPIHWGQVASPSDDEWRRATRKWLSSVLVGAGNVGTVIKTFISTFDLQQTEGASAVPAKSLLFIQGDDEISEERRSRL